MKAIWMAMPFTMELGILYEPWFSNGQILQADFVCNMVEVGVEWDYWVRYFLYDISFKVMPWTLFDATSTIFWVVKLVVTCWDRWSIAN